MHARPSRGLDEDGFILPEVAFDRVPPAYLPIIANLRARCRAAFAADLDGLYLNGSIVKGTARPGVSDVDALALLRVAPHAEHEERASAVAQAVAARFPFVTEVGLGLWLRDEILSAEQRFDMGFYLKCLCVCVDGDAVGHRLPRYRPSIELARGTNGDIRRLIDDRRQRLASTLDPAAVAYICRGIMRKIIRTGFTLVMPRYQGWTSDLEPAVTIFAEYYPERAAAMQAALQLATVPSSDRELVCAVLDSLGVWLADEYERIIMNWA